MTFDDWLIGRLRWHCVYDGKLDGVHGRAVIAAIERFQKNEGLPVTGRADQATVDALRVDKRTPSSGLVQMGPTMSIPAEPVWLREARRFAGLKEVAGPQSNPTIIGWAKRFGGWIASFFTNDDIPWCGLFAAHVIAMTLPKERLPANPLGALNWKMFGKQSPVALGAILVFKRDGGGHVGFYVGEDRTHYHVLGGNQDNQVKVSRIAKDRLEAVRWPITGDARQGGAVQMSAHGAPVSETES